MQKCIIENLNACLDTNSLVKFQQHNNQKITDLRKQAQLGVNSLQGLRDYQTKLIKELDACVDYSASRIEYRVKIEKEKEEEDERKKESQYRIILNDTTTKFQAMVKES